MTPSISRRRGTSRRNKANNQVSSLRGAVDVHIASVIKPYRSDPIIKNFKIRYQATGSIPAFLTITRQFMLNSLFMGRGAFNSGLRLLSGVRLVSLTLYTATTGSIQWLSSYSPTSETTVNGTSTTAPGVLATSPPPFSTASFWSQTNFNESENLFIIVAGQGDYVDAHFQIVLMDDEAVVTNVTTVASQSVGQLYRSYLDGPQNAASYWKPVGVTTIA